MASLLELLLSHKVISTDQAREAATLAEETGAFVGRILVAQGAVEEDRLAGFLAHHCTVRPSPADLDIDQDLVNLLPERLMRKYRVVPLKQDTKGVLTLAVVDPLSIGGLDQVKRRLGLPMKLVIVDSGTVDRLLARVLARATSRNHGTDLSGVKAPAAEAVISESPAETSADAVRDTELDEAESAARAGGKITKAAHAEGAMKHMDEPGAQKSLRSANDRIVYPVSWKPEPVTEDLPDALENTIETLKSILEGPDQKYAVLAGSDVARDLVLRKLFATVFLPQPGRYVDLFAYRYPEDESLEFPSALIIDGLDAVSLEDEEEQRAMLSDISRAFSSRIPFVVGVRIPPAESKSLPGGFKLTLGLGKLVRIETEEHSVHEDKIDRFFQHLVDETIRWSEEAFPGAGLQSLLSTVMDAYNTGNKGEAITKGSAAVASRISRLTKE